MRKKTFCSVLVMMSALLLVGAGSLMAASVTPTTVAPWQSGNSGFECAAASAITGVDYQYHCKIDDWYGDMNGTYTCPLDTADSGDNSITILNSDGTFFDWSATHPIGAVIVKGGNAANIFAYDPQAYSDTDLFAPNNPSGKPAAVSHVTFCWNPEEELCYSYETAWAAGNRYVTRGNWATWTPYNGTAKTVDLIAGQHYVAGTVEFSAPVAGMVTITIQLNPGWYFAYGDAHGMWDESVHIQGYNSRPPAKNPAPGLFAYKYPAEGQTFSRQVPVASFAYGVHTKLAVVVPCE